MLWIPSPQRLLAVVALAAMACTASSEEVRPRPDQLFFPTGLAVSPDDTTLFVVNANSELRYDSGTVTVIDLAKVDDVVDGWKPPKMQVPPTCRRDSDFLETLVCDEADFIRADAGVRTGNFGTAIAVQQRGDRENLRLWVPTRGDPSATWIDWNADERRLRCDDGAEGFALCDDTHRLSRMRGDDRFRPMPAEPFGVYADSTGDYAVMTHLSEGAMTLIDSPRDGVPVLVDVFTGVFPKDQNPRITLHGASAIAGRQGLAGNSIYVAGRNEGRIRAFSVGRLPNQPPLMVPTHFFFLDGIGTNTGGSIDTRAMAFNQSGERLFLINRSPATLQIYDTSLDERGVPRNRAFGGVGLCREGAGLTVADVGAGDRAYVTCFSDGEVWVVDPRNGGELEAVVQVGRGPYGVAVAPSRHKLYVSNFLEDTLAVIDLTPSAPTRNRVVLRIGEPRP